MVWFEVGSTVLLHGSVISVFRRWHANEKLTGSKLLMHTSIAQTCHSTFCNPFKMLFTLFAFGDEWCVAHRVPGVIDYIGTIF